MKQLKSMCRTDRVQSGGHPAERKDSPPKRQLQYFFKIILPCTIQDKKLRMPPLFSRTYWDELSDIATLNVPPHTRVWKVGLTKSGRDILFDSGWAEFMQHYLFQLGYFLIFKYKGMSSFSVRIFSRTACEVLYPFSEASMDIEPSYSHEPLEDDDKSCEILEPNPPSKKIGMTNLAKDNTADEKDLTEEYFNEEVQLNASEQVHSKCSKGQSRERDQKAIQAAEMFKPNNPSFMLVLQSNHIHKHWAYVPGAFAAEYLSQLINGHIKIQGSDGREWLLRAYKRGKSGGLMISAGFVAFIKDNNLKEGDVCVFEKIMEEEAALKATLFRSHSGLEINECQKNNASTEVPKSEHESRTDKCFNEEEMDLVDASKSNKRKLDQINGAADKLGKLEKYDAQIITSEKFSKILAKASPKSKIALKAAKMIKSNYPCFVVILQPLNVGNCRMYIPAEFANKYLRGIGNQIKIHVSDGKEWLLDCKWRDRGGLLIKMGRTLFFKENDLMIGDVCRFELINSADFVLRATIFHVH